MKTLFLISAMGLVCAGAASGAYAQELGHVISSKPVIQDGRSYFDVQYEYAGKQYFARMPYDPGQTIQLQVTPAANGQATNGAAPEGVPPGVAPPAPQQAQATILREVPAGTPVAPAYPVYPAYGYAYPGYYPAYPAAYPAYPAYYYPRYYWPPISLSLGFGYVSGGHGHGHRHRH